MDKAKKQAIEEQKAPQEHKKIYEGKMIDLHVDTIHLPHVHRTREVVTHPGASAILPIDHEGNLILIKQWRHAVKDIIIEIPAGILEKGEEPIICAQRELQEETGYKAHKMYPMGGVFTAPGFCNEYIFLFLAKDLEESYLSPDENEAIDLFRISLEDALAMIENNQINDAKTIIAILRYQAWKKKKI